MSSNITATTYYDPTNDTTNIIITGLLPLLLFGLYKGFENDKKQPFSLINIFDDSFLLSYSHLSLELNGINTLVRRQKLFLLHSTLL